MGQWTAYQRAADQRTDGATEAAADRRAMSTLLSLVTAIAVLTVVTGGTLIVVEDAFRETERGDAERAVALQASERLVAADGPVADSPNLLQSDGLDDLNESDLRGLGASDRFAMAVSVDGTRRADVGNPGTGHVIRRIVLVEHTQRVQRTPPVSAQEGHEVTLPVRTEQIGLALDPPNGTTVTAVRSDGRVVLENGSGLAGTHEFATAQYSTLHLTFDTEGPLRTGDVEVEYSATSREKAILAVTVDDATTASAEGEAA